MIGLEPLAVAGAIGLVADHALGEEAGEGLVEVEVTAFGHGAGVKARIEQMQDRMLDPADVLVDRQPIVDRRAFDRRVGARTAEAGEIPGRLHEGIEGIGFPLGRLAAARAVRVLPGRMVGQRIARCLEGHVLRQPDRQFLAGHRDDAAVGAVDDGNRAAPVALAGNAPVAQAVLHLAGPGPGGLQGLDDGRLGRLDLESVEEFGVDHGARADIGLVADLERLARGRGR